LSVAWREADIQFAVELADALIEKFYDSEEGGFSLPLTIMKT